jgi:hypothetical protein
MNKKKINEKIGIKTYFFKNVESGLVKPTAERTEKSKKKEE